MSRLPLDTAPAQEPKAPSRWQELSDGSAGPTVRTVVSIALAPLLAGLAFLGSYVLAEWLPSWSYRWNGLVRPTDELVGGTLGLAAVAYLVGVSWIWTRSRYTLHEFWKAGLLTACVAVVTVVVCVVIEGSPVWRAAEEVLIGGVICLAGSAAMLIWLQAARRYVRRLSVTHTADGALDLRCPACGYSMVGLRESRCPECGTSYTLDELVTSQAFSRASTPARHAAAPPVPTPAGSANGAGQAESVDPPVTPRAARTTGNPSA